jgi:hypothetical protein
MRAGGRKKQCGAKETLEHASVMHMALRNEDEEGGQCVGMAGRHKSHGESIKANHGM